MATVVANDPMEAKDGGGILAEKEAAVETTEAESKTEESSPKDATSESKVDEKEKLEAADSNETAEAAAPNDSQAANGPLKEPLAHPLETCKPEPPPELTPEMLRKYDEVLAAVSAWTEVPATSGYFAAKEPLTDDDRLFLTRECLLRYLRASKWDAPTAQKRLLATLTWRREYGLLGFTHEYIAPENETGKQVILGYDNEARPALYLNPSRQNTERSDRQLQHLFYNMERVIELMGPGQESLALLVNFMDTRKGQGASIGQARQTMSVLQNHYPERLGRALITDLPWYITTFFKMISPFIDPHTRTKMIFNEPIAEYIPPEQLLVPFGGSLEFEYDHDVYWPALDKLCSTRRRDYHERWVKAGKQIGEHETYLKGGDAKSLNGELLGSDFEEGFAEKDQSS